MEENGFFEVEIGRVTERYGNVVQAFSSHESRRTLQDEKPYARGVTSFQLFYDGSCWWVVSIFWEGETPATRFRPSTSTRSQRGGTTCPPARPTRPGRAPGVSGP
ncbi:MAG: hypothetical protein R2909_23725 [Gemmatimonadales bacterium]